MVNKSLLKKIKKVKQWNQIGENIYANYATFCFHLKPVMRFWGY